MCGAWFRAEIWDSRDLFVYSTLGELGRSSRLVGVNLNVGVISWSVYGLVGCAGINVKVNGWTTEGVGVLTCVGLRVGSASVCLPETWTVDVTNSFSGADLGGGLGWV